MKISNKPLMLKTITLLIVMHLAWNVNAQTNQTDTLENLEKSLDSIQLKPIGTIVTNSQWGLSLNLTTNGIGLGIAKSVHSKNKVIAKLEGAYLPLSIKNYEVAAGSSKLLVNSTLKLGSIGFYFDWHPFSNSFKLTGGMAYMFTNLAGDVIFKDSIVQGEVKVAPKDIGTIEIKLKTMPIVPYLGLGFGRSIPKTRVNIGFDLGAYYISSPLLTFKCTGMLEPTSNQEKQLNDNLSVNVLLPIIRLNLNIKL